MVADDIDLAWHVGFVSPIARSAERVETFVQRLGFETWWPKEVVLKKRPRRANLVSTSRGTASRYITTAVSRALWPRYVLLRLPREGAPFARLADDHAKAFGLWGVVRTGGGPAIIADEVVADLQAREALGEWNRTTRIGRKLTSRPPDWAAPGARVEIADGPFASFEAVVEEVVGMRARVSVSIFGRSSPVELDLRQLRR